MSNNELTKEQEIKISRDKAIRNKVLDEVKREVENLNRNSEGRVSELECSQEGYEYGLEDISTIINNLRVK